MEHCLFMRCLCVPFGDQDGLALCTAPLRGEQSRNEVTDSFHAILEISLKGLGRR